MPSIKKLCLRALCAVALCVGASFAAAMPTDEQLMSNGLAALNQHKFGDAVADFQKVLKHTPTHYGANFQLGRALDGAGKKQQARAQWKKALAMALSIRDWETANLCMGHLPDLYPAYEVTTSLGNFFLRLDRSSAPASADNFIAYAGEKFFDGTIFNRIYPGSFVQGGGITPDGKPKPHARPAIKLESQNGLKNIRGAVVMARTDAPDSAEVQWFIDTADNAWMDYHSPSDRGYAVFGYVVGGMDVVDKIQNVPLNPDTSPKTPVVIVSVRPSPKD